MKQNKYDDEKFFNNYSEMERSKHGLSSAGEWHILKEMLPDFEGKTVLDLGCGYGWHSIYASENGAKNVIGVDISRKMLEVAREKSKGNPSITYMNKAIEDIEFDENQFDIVISSLAFHYIKEFDTLVRKISSWIKPNGTFVFSVEHPIFTSRDTQDWIFDEDEKPKYWAVDNYHEESIRYTKFLEVEVAKYHRTIATYMNDVVQAGFQITQVEESYPSKEALETHPFAKNDMRRPMFLLVSAVK